MVENLFTNCADITAAQSSNLGIETNFTGATRDLAASKQIFISFLLIDFRYQQAP